MVAVAHAARRQGRGWLAASLSVLLLAGACSGDAEPAATPSGRSSTGATGGTVLPSAGPTVSPPTTASPGTTPSPAPTTSQGAPSRPVPPERPAVAPTATAVASDRVAVSLSRIEAVQGVAFAPGEIAGPALRITVRLTNDASTPLDLGMVAVNAYIGKDRVPAGTVTKPGGRPFVGDLAAGRVADGVYLFVVPVADRDDVTVTVDHRADLPTAVFRGAMP